MSYLMPEDILNSGSHSEYRPQDIKTMLGHHGFTLLRSHASHFMYGNPDFPRLNMTLVFGHGDCKRADAVKAAHACLAVKRLQTQEAVKPNDALPDWVEGVIKAKFSHFKTDPDGNILRIYYEPNGGTRRSYRIEMLDGKLSILNREYRDDEHHDIMCLKNGSDHPKAFQTIFQQLDGNVSGYMAGMEREYSKLIDDLEREYGFELCVDVENGDVQGGVLHITHPQYHLDYTMPLHRPHETMADGSLATLRQAANDFDILLNEQESFLQRLVEKGWDCVHRPVSVDAPGALDFTAPSNKKFSLPTHGDFEVFDLKQLKDWELAEDRKNPVVPASSVNSTQHAGYLVLGGFVTSQPDSVPRRA